MNYKVLVTDEAINDIFDLVKYIHVDLCNPDAANKLYENLNKEIDNMGDFPLKFSDSGMSYRGYIINDKNQEVFVLRILKDIVNWHRLLKETKIYHFPHYK
ncbi:MAG: type II toxin-antitoxin system RelE/ParE family toxin [Lachnospiraceae bacterium]|nr:type II toxin-antitoxin system RelE/ParE family toxin [Lachnospiraceae bacterium]